MLDEMLSAYGSNLTIAVVGVAAGFLCLILVLWLMRGRGGPSPFLRGGKNRQPRLQVLDAAAVDTRRRLVLVRRDDVEHLIMIGGPTDIVIESSIVEGRSPPYHTLMKTVSEPERAAISADEEPRAAQSSVRSVEVATPAPAAVATERPESPATSPRTAAKDDFAWLGSEPVELPRAASPVAAARPAPTPAVRTPEVPVPVSPNPAPTTPVPPARTADAQAAAASRPSDVRSAIDASSDAPPAPSVSRASPAPVAPAVSASSAAIAGGPSTIPPVTITADPIDLVRATTVPSQPPSEAARHAEPRFDVDTPRSDNNAPSLDHAVDLLDAARERVFQPARADVVAPAAVSATPGPATRPTSAASPQPLASAPAKPLGSDFERILEEEMASNLASGGTAPAIVPAASNAPAGPAASRRDPALPRVTGASQEPALQNEIARIFGEMSVTRNDR